MRRKKKFEGRPFLIDLCSELKRKIIVRNLIIFAQSIIVIALVLCRLAE